MAGLELLSEQGYRVDGRRAGELRQIRARLGVFAQADGSAYLEQGNTKALAVVYGPHEMRGSRGKALPDQALLNCQFSLATFSTDPAGGRRQLLRLGERGHPGGHRRHPHAGLRLRHLGRLPGGHAPGRPELRGGGGRRPPDGPGAAAQVGADCAAG
uniref:Exosome component 4 n=1 Tax=Podarcis muralis TaxID=64176 RepID=A0A670IVT7_PODMU